MNRIGFSLILLFASLGPVFAQSVGPPPSAVTTVTNLPPTYPDGTFNSPLSLDTAGNLRVITAASSPQTLVPTNSSTDALSHAISTSLDTVLIAIDVPSNLYGFNCSAITGGASGYCIAYNGTSEPAPGALDPTKVLDFCYFGDTPRGCSLSRIPLAVQYSAGIVILISSASTPYTYTDNVLTGAITVDYK
jgi:hypothetical protein